MTVSIESPGRQRNPRGEGSRLRLEIIEATHQLLADAEPVTLRSIARRAGVAAPSIYRHFADVDAIMSTVADQAFDDLVAAIVEKRDAADGSIPRLHAISDAYLAFASDQSHLYRLMFGGVWNAPAAIDAHPEQEERLRGLGMNAYAVLVEAIDECVRDGASDSTDSRQDATALWVGLHGLAELRQTARLFPWPPNMDRVLVTQLARLRTR